MDRKDKGNKDISTTSMTTGEGYKYILLMVLIATSFLFSGSADCITVPWYTIPNAPAEE